ncbi:MAG: sigma-54 dependent transcriptional regulator [Blastocatellia bacterium]|nr:sigma-54 dependent transcriptional regulator [Blastocatellia bacterium]MCS7156256.1 sigma-54 dependent transcriptional regulator [Blastocatellia bacterium]MCX7751394.1 sigma-54 dependent transcriptional regulator [Blastocatellia bacterium]MDW8169107.1 sigma-54 dependent transcriptional regulator [Acidobacteriota bacterium]MDW8255811.1 sigma-54 dependent transcriptional regulator [Acidobacteriota bacterium]
MTLPKDKVRILIVDDEAVVRESLGNWFREEGYLVDVAGSGKETLQKLAESSYDLFLIDIKMPGMDGLQLQRRIREIAPDATIIIMTAYASVETAVEAMKQGAYDYIVKPFDPDQLEHVIRNAVERKQLVAENIRLRERLQEMELFHEIIGQSPAIRRVLEQIRLVAMSDTTVLIRGESGTGKELVARAIHANSPRRYMPIVIVNCGALAEGVIESELFGHEKGAFTGAHYRRKGKFELADGGTLFLDEIGDISLKTQVDLLRVLEEKKIFRVGGNTPISVDFRLIAATNKDLEALVAEGKFREDLYYRINVFSITIPPLRERREDIPLLAEHFLKKFARSMNKPVHGISTAAMALLQQYDWPGNVRELQNAIERAVLVCRGREIQPEDLPLYVNEARESAVGKTLAEVERQHIARILQETGWNISQAARLLGIDRVTLYNKIRKYQLKPDSPR